MADILKVPGELIVSNMNKWKNGELPDANKFQTLFGAFQASLSTIAQIIGPVLNTNPLVYSKDKIISTGTFYEGMSDEDKTNWLIGLSDQITNTFNLARVIGPHGVLNPQYLPGSIHPKESLGSGYQLATNAKIQQLPFPPASPYTASITGVSGWTLASSKEEVLSAITKKYYIDSSGVLYLSRELGDNAILKYDLYIPNTYSYLGSGYNCIPDLSILTISEESRTDVLDGDYGLAKIEYVDSSADSSTWRITLPKVISLRDPLLSQASRQISNVGYEPVGIWESATNSKWYTLNWSELYNSEVLDRNTVALFNKETKETFILEWQPDPDETNVVQRTYLVTGPGRLTDKFYQNDRTSLLKNGGSNSRDFFVFSISSTITEQLAQVSLNYSKHKHNGVDSYKISHKDLLDAEGNKQGLGDQTGSNGGLDFINLNRQLAYSESQDNVHPQYLHRLGYTYGGTAGKYEAAANVNKIIDLNMLHGDLVLGPIEDDAAQNTYSYKYSSAGAASSAGDEEINWTLTSSDVAASLEVLDEKRSHSLVFGIPSTALPGIFYQAWYGGSTRLYFEPHVFDTDTKYDKKAELYTLARHGFIPGDLTNRKYFSKNNHTKGLNITYGNMFFGYREDLFGGLLTTPGLEETESSAYFRAAEFNIVTTANGKAGQNTNSVLKNGYRYRDGFSVKALKGSNIWLSVGGENDGSNALSSTENPGSFALDVSLAGASDEYADNPKGIRARTNKRNRAAGAGILATPSLRADGSISWVDFEDGNQSIASLWDNDIFVKNNGDAYIENSVLDIFNLATDYQTSNDQFTYIMPGTDSNIRMWTAGRPFIRGTYGINFCVNGNFEGLSSYFKTGYHRRDESTNWGPNEVLLLSTEDTDHEYIHREFRFWGSNEEINPDQNSNSLANTTGGNLNLLYNFQRDYQRFGLTIGWNSDAGSLSGGLNTYSPWANARSISLGTSTPENYGSAIRQASFIDAFAGFRNDPLQPYVAEYTIPFKAAVALGKVSDYPNGIDIEEQIKKVTFILGGDGGLSSPLIPALKNPSFVVDAADVDYYQLASTQTTFNDLRIDGLIRGSEEILISNSYEIAAEDNKRFPSSLVDFNVKLQYFMGKLVGGGGSSGSADTPHHSPHKYYLKVLEGDIEMVPAYQSPMGTPDTGNKIPIVMVDNGNKNGLGLFNNNSVIPYSAAIGLWPASNGIPTYRALFPLFEEKYGTDMSNKVFTLLLNIDDRTDESYNINSPVPYRIVVESSDSVILEFVGSINFKMMTSYHKAPQY